MGDYMTADSTSERSQLTSPAQAQRKTSRILYNVTRVLLGLMFVVLGLNGFFYCSFRHRRLAACRQSPSSGTLRCSSRITFG